MNNLRTAAFFISLICCNFLAAAQNKLPADYLHESKTQFDARMSWWNEARFGLFIHWGLYSIPAGEWKGKTDYGEWIRHSARIPLEEYNGFLGQFNPVKFDAEEWVRTAKEAGMKYIVITSKHHDGFCLFDSKYTDFNVMSTPFKRDILEELSAACKKEGIKLCLYHSIMDWHDPDYLPRRDWETARTMQGANFDRYVLHMKNQMKELLTNYGDIGVLWFDGNWERTWSNKRGLDLYAYVRSLQPNIIINNRVGQPPPSESGVGFRDVGFVGDFGTPEQEIPPTGLPGKFWETCMTMNDHWGYNKQDSDWKSAGDLICKLVDIASKGGNFLLNVGPTSEGVFPEASIERLHKIGAWMKVNGEAIHGTMANPFADFKWGRCTRRLVDSGLISGKPVTRLYLHVFDWPHDGKLVVPGLANHPKQAYLLADIQKNRLPVTRNEDALMIDVPPEAPDSVCNVVVLDVDGKLDVINPPKISADYNIFIDDLNVSLSSEREDIDIRYTLDGGVPTAQSHVAFEPIRLTQTCVVSGRCFRDDVPVSAISQMNFTKVHPRPPVDAGNMSDGIQYTYYVGSWDSVPNFGRLWPVKKGILPGFDLFPKTQSEYFGFIYDGFIDIKKDGVYAFFTESDDGSRLNVEDSLVVANDGLHAMEERSGAIALAAGLHPVRVTFFQKSGDVGLTVSYKGPGVEKQSIPPEVLFHKQ